MNFNLELNYEGFEDYYIIHGSRLDGAQYIFRFDNNYGASVVKWTGTYGYESDLWELAMIQFDEDGDYDLVDDVVGHLTDGEVCWYLGKIKELSKGLPLITDSH